MSFRFHKTAPQLTLYHDASSPSSLRALALLQRVQRSGGSGIDLASTTPAPSSSSGQAFLQAAVSSEDALQLQLEVRHRTQEPPTPTQLHTILEYLKQADQETTVDDKTKGTADVRHDNPPQHTTAIVPGPHNKTVASTRLTPGQIRARVKAYPSATATSTSSSPSATDILSSSPPPPFSSTPLHHAALLSQLNQSELLLVDWDNGWAVKDFAGVQRLVQHLQREQQQRVGREKGRATAGGPCMIS